MHMLKTADLLDVSLLKNSLLTYGSFDLFTYLDCRFHLYYR